MLFGLKRWKGILVVIKVLHVYKTYYPNSTGGIEQAILQLASQSPKFGIEAKVLSLSKNNTLRITYLPGHTAYEAKQNFEIASTGFSFSMIFKFKQMSEEADIIHYHFPWPYMDLLHLMMGIKKPTIITYHSDIIRQKYLFKVYKPLMNAFMKSVNKIIVTSPNYLVSSETLFQYKNKVNVIPIGLNMKSYREPDFDRITYWKQQLNKEKFFLFIGVLRYYKGLEILLDALALEEYPVVIIGSGPMESKLKAKASVLGLNQIQFLGFLPDEDKIAILSLSYCIIFPSHLRSEAFGISLLEGAMFSKPLISCEIGTGTSFINIDQETGIVVPPSDPKSLSRAISFLWHDEMKAKKFGESAYTRYLKLFTAENMASQFLSVYKELINKK